MQRPTGEKMPMIFIVGLMRVPEAVSLCRGSAP